VDEVSIHIDHTRDKDHGNKIKDVSLFTGMSSCPYVPACLPALPVYIEIYMHLYMLYRDAHRGRERVFGVRRQVLRL
jgi:hypothetical protein